MNPGIVAAAAVLAIGAIVAISAREGRVAVLGLALALVAAPLVSEPLPAITSLAIRLTGAVLAAYLILAVLRTDATTTLGTHLGWPVQILQAVAAAIIGYGIASQTALGAVGLGTPVGGTGGGADGGAETIVSLGVAAGAAVLVVAIEPIVAARDGLRLGIGLLLALTGVTVMRTALLGSVGGIEHIVVAATIASIAAATAVICLGAAASGGSLSLSRLPRSIRARRPAGPERRHHPDDPADEEPA